MKAALAILLATALFVPAQGANVDPDAANDAEPIPTVEADKTRVSILGYHDFSKSAPETEMRIRTGKFRRQLEVVRDLGITVISMDQFIRWKSRELDLPEECVMITIDDGWKAVYTEAFPILREFGYPFTIFLYKDYIEGGNKALSSSMITEMLQHGATIGSHSVSHPYPKEIKQLRSESIDKFTRFLRTEMGESKRYLEMTFGQDVDIYAYPGGFFTDDMFPLSAEVGYSHLFTVEPGKVTRDSPDRMLPRYMILGTHDRVFELATDFHPVPTQPAGVIAGLTRETQQPVSPSPGSLCNDRLPLIEADLTAIEDLDPESVVMQVGGFGTVPARFDPGTQRLAWKVDRRLRQRFCHVKVSWKDAEGSAPEKPLRWSFQIERSSAYLPQNRTLDSEQ